MPGANHKPGIENSSSIIWSTHHKMYVAGCDLIYHELTCCEQSDQRVEWTAIYI